MKIKNVRAGIVIIADAGIKLAPGETMEVENPTRQTLTAVAGGLLAHVDAEPEAKSKTKTAGRAAESKAESKKTTAPVATEKQPVASEADTGSDSAGENRLFTETDNGAD